MESFINKKVSVNTSVKFMMNGGMFDPQYDPVGLYIENNNTLNPVNIRKEGFGNFYIQPNGIFIINIDDSAEIIKTEDFTMNKEIKFATQSGPILVWNGEINSYFNIKSENIHIRNAVGIKGNGELLFVISTQKVTFYQISEYLAENGCIHALYLDGFVSNMYIKETGYIHPDDFQYGVMIAELE